MSTLINKNELIDKFSSPMGNSEIRFIDYAKTNKISDYKLLINEFQSMQNQVYDYIYKITEPNKQLTASEIEKISHDFCKANFDWINSKGIKAINSWLIWMCWHEGILKKD